MILIRLKQNLTLMINYNKFNENKPAQLNSRPLRQTMGCRMTTSIQLRTNRNKRQLYAADSTEASEPPSPKGPSDLDHGETQPQDMFRPKDCCTTGSQTLGAKTIQIDVDNRANLFKTRFTTSPTANNHTMKAPAAREVQTQAQNNARQATG